MWLAILSQLSLFLSNDPSLLFKCISSTLSLVYKENKHWIINNKTHLSKYNIKIVFLYFENNFAQIVARLCVYIIKLLYIDYSLIYYLFIT